MTYYKSTHGHDNSVINGIGRIGSQWGGKAALWNDETMTDEFVSRSKAWLGETRQVQTVLPLLRRPGHPRPARA